MLQDHPVPCEKNLRKISMIVRTNARIKYIHSLLKIDFCQQLYPRQSQRLSKHPEVFTRLSVTSHHPAAGPVVCRMSSTPRLPLLLHVPLPHGPLCRRRLPPLLPLPPDAPVPFPCLSLHPPHPPLSPLFPVPFPPLPSSPPPVHQLTNFCRLRLFPSPRYGSAST